MSIYSHRMPSADGSKYHEWLLYEQASYHRPVCILSHHEMTRLIRDFAKVDPETVRQILNEGTEAE